jgi:hypothetical protein
MHVSYLQIHELLGSKKQKQTNDTARSRDETVMTEIGMAPDLLHDLYGPQRSTSLSPSNPIPGIGLEGDSEVDL